MYPSDVQEHIGLSITFRRCKLQKKLAYGTMSVYTHLFWYASGVSTMCEELSH